MSEFSFEQAIGAMLQDPEQMQKIFALAQSLGFSPPAAQQAPPPPPEPPVSPPPTPKQEASPPDDRQQALGELLQKAGKLDRRDEDRLLAAQRELREETGAEAGEWTSLGVFYPACAYSDEAIEMYLAQGLHQGEQKLDKDEFLNVETRPLKELVDEVMAGKIVDIKTQAAILKAARLVGV